MLFPAPLQTTAPFQTPGRNITLPQSKPAQALYTEQNPLQEALTSGQLARAGVLQAGSPAIRSDGRCPKGTAMALQQRAQAEAVGVVPPLPLLSPPSPPPPQQLHKLGQSVSG